jgi:hypothetical protein
MPICDARELACLRPAIVLSTNRLLPRQHRHVFSFYRFSPFSRICFCVVQRLCHCLPLLSSPTTFPSCCPLLHPPPVHSYRAVLLPRCVVLPRWHSNVMPAPKAAVCYYTVRNTHTHARGSSRGSVACNHHNSIPSPPPPLLRGFPGLFHDTLWYTC